MDGCTTWHDNENDHDGPDLIFDVVKRSIARPILSGTAAEVSPNNHCDGDISETNDPCFNIKQ